MRRAPVCGRRPPRRIADDDGEALAGVEILGARRRCGEQQRGTDERQSLRRAFMPRSSACQSPRRRLPEMKKAPASGEGL